MESPNLDHEGRSVEGVRSTAGARPIPAPSLPPALCVFPRGGAGVRRNRAPAPLHQRCARSASASPSPRSHT